MQISVVVDKGLELDARLKRYILCLGMVHLIVESELNEACDVSLFRQLGIVASFIDEQLDKLNIDQRKQFLVQFDTLFKSLIEAKNSSNFKNAIRTFSVTENLTYTASNHNLDELYQFIQYCNDKGLSDYLNSFGKGIINCSIDKQKATNTKQIRLILKREGALVCSLLEKLLKINHIQNTKLNHTMRFLVECEQILNVADDSFDAFEDNRTNIIKLKNPLLHGFIMIGYLVKQVAKTFVIFPKQSFFYTPVLISYFLRNK